MPVGDRLARVYAYQVIVLDELARHGVSVRFTDTPPLDDDPQAKLLTLWGSRSRPELVTCGDRRSTLQD